MEDERPNIQAHALRPPIWLRGSLKLKALNQHLKGPTFLIAGFNRIHEYILLFFLSFESISNLLLPAYLDEKIASHLFFALT